VAGPGSDLSKESAFRMNSATLDSVSFLAALPNPNPCQLLWLVRTSAVRAL
jgi:hypothetical protein